MPDLSMLQSGAVLVLGVFALFLLSLLIIWIAGRWGERGE